MAYDVIVVGARCAGAPLAMLLARAGHSVLLLDRSRFPSDTMSTHWVLRPGVELLASWGLLETLTASGCPPIGRLCVDFGRVVLAGVPMATDGPAVTYAPRRTVLDASLVEAARAAGAEVREGVPVRDVLWSDGAVAGVTGRSADGGSWTERARLVVGADGRNSTIARAVHARMTDDRGPLAATAYGYWSDVPADGAHTYVRPGAGVSLWPTHDDLVVVALTFPRRMFLDRTEDIEPTYLRQLRRIPELAERLGRGRLVTRVRAAGNLRNFHRQSHGPGWALVGDAGHHMDPIGAHGISSAFTDAGSLAAAIHDGLTGTMPLDRRLARYQARRNADRSAVFELTCRQAALRSPDGDLERLLHTAYHSRRITEDLLSVFAGSRRVEEVFGRAGLARAMGSTSVWSGNG